jgi:hypothetical protein
MRQSVVESHSKTSNGSGLSWDECIDEALDARVGLVASGEGGEANLREGLESGLVVELAAGA